MMPPEDMAMMMQKQPQQDPQMGGMMQQDPMMQAEPMPKEEMGMMMMPDQGQMAPQEQQEEPDLATSSIESIILNTNLAKQLKKKKVKSGGDTLLLDKMAEEILDGITLDEQSRTDWLAQNEEGYKLALLIAETKTWPWPDSSNIKYPLIATAAMQFSARAYPALVTSDGAIVKARAIPGSVNSMYLDTATKIARHMSWQLMVKDQKWEIEMDKLLMTLSVVGSMFKKTYYDAQKNQNCSYIIYPQDFIIDYHATNVAEAYRKTEVLRYTNNQIQEKIRNDEEFLDIEYGEPEAYEPDQERLERDDTAPSINKATPHIFYQCHTYWDLDDDGYEEPVIITIHKKTRKVVNVTVRFTSEGIFSNENGEIQRITPLEYYTAFTFIENPIGSLYGVGYGLLLGPINDAINTTINMLIDGGKINNLQSGFLSKTLRLNMAQTPMKPGEWKVVNASGDELKNGIVPLPTKEPSPVLMQLIQMLIQSGMQLASVAEIFVGKMPGQNTPATTTQQTVEQSMAVFTAVYKRVFRSLGEEYRKLMYLNKINPSLVMEEAEESGLDIAPKDYQLPAYSIIPGADPTGDSQSVKQQKFAWVVQAILPLGTIDPMWLTRWGLEIMEIPNYEQAFPKQPPQPPPPDPKVMQAQASIQAKQAELKMKQEDRGQEMKHKEALAALKYAEKQQEMEAKQLERDQKLRESVLKGRIDAVNRVDKARAEKRASQIKTSVAREEMLSKFAENRQTHAEKIRQMRETKQEKAREGNSKPK